MLFKPHLSFISDILIDGKSLLSRISFILSFINPPTKKNYRIEINKLNIKKIIPNNIASLLINNSRPLSFLAANKLELPP